MYLIKDNQLDRYTDGNGNYFTLSKVFVEKEKTKDGVKLKLRQYYSKDIKSLAKSK